MSENLLDIYDHDTVGVSKSEKPFHLRLRDREFEKVFTRGEWADFVYEYGESYAGVFAYFFSAFLQDYFKGVALILINGLFH